MVAAYRTGEGVGLLAARFDVHRTTVTAHLNRRAVKRHAVGKEWSKEELASAAELYAHGESLADVAARYSVDASTVARRFRRARIPIRPRRGWT